MNLTEFFNSLNQIDKRYNKYATYSLTFGNPYKLASSYDAFKYDKFDLYLKNWIAEQGKCIVMPNLIENEVIGLVFRSIQSKQFRHYTEAKYIPYGAGINKKPYYKPWLIVESALDSDFLRNFYPFVIATNGTAATTHIMSFLQGTCSTLYCGFDSDKAGEDAFHHLCMKYSGRDKEFHIKRFKPPTNFSDKPLKDFGEVLDLLYNNNIEEYDYCVSQIKYTLNFMY